MTYEKQLKRFAESDVVEPAEEVKPETTELTKMLYEAFNDLSSERTWGFLGPEAITTRMCMDYCELHGIHFVVFFSKAIKAADAVWLGHRKKK